MVVAFILKIAQEKTEKSGRPSKNLEDRNNVNHFVDAREISTGHANSSFFQIGHALETIRFVSYGICFVNG